MWVACSNTRGGERPCWRLLCWAGGTGGGRSAAGGLWVSSNAAGTQASSALRFALAPGESAPVLTLKLNSSSGNPAVVACPTTSAWKAGDDQPLSAAPKPDCAKGQVVGSLSTDAKSMTFDLSNIDTTSGGADLAIIPSPPTDPTGGAASGAPKLYPVFDVTFSPVTSAQIAVTVTPLTPTQAPTSVGAPSASDVNAAQPSGAALNAALPALATPSAPSGPLAAPSTSASVPARSPVASVPQRTLRAPSRQIAPSRIHKASSRTRVIEGIALLGLASLVIPNGGRAGELAATLSGGGAPKRPRLTLYDVAPARASGPSPPVSRRGKVPALR